MPSRTIACLLTLLLVALSGGAAAQTGDKAEARELFFKARDALNAGDFVAAADLYRRTNDLYPAPTSALGLARSLVQLGRLVEASAVYTKLAETSLAEDAVDAFKEAVTAGVVEGQVVDKRIPRLTVLVEGPAPSGVQLDGHPVVLSGNETTLRLDPGKHSITAALEGYQPFERTIALAESTVTELRVVLVPVARKEEPKPQVPVSTGLDELEVAGLVIGGVGVAGLVVWGATGIVYLANESTVESDCTGDICATQKGVDAADRAKTIGVVNTVSFFAGLGLAALGTTLFLVGGSNETTEPAVALRIGSHVSVEGTF